MKEAPQEGGGHEVGPNLETKPRFKVAIWEIPRDCWSLNDVEGQGEKTYTVHSIYEEVQQVFQEPGLNNKGNS